MSVDSLRGCRIALGILLGSAVALVAHGGDRPGRPDKDPHAPLSSRRTICHRSPNGNFSMKTISASSVEKHLRHGDCLVDDRVACTIDSCERDQGCVHTPDHARCQDRQFCTTNSCDTTDGCVAVDTCPPFVDGCIRRNVCDEDNQACVDRPDDQLCDDGQFCTTERCNAETGACRVINTCPAFNVLLDCLTYGRCDEAAGACPADPLTPCCGNGVCEAGEDATNCSEDCKCPNGICEAGEDAVSCPSDCVVCGDGVCDPGEDASNCPQDCGT